MNIKSLLALALLFTCSALRTGAQEQPLGTAKRITVNVLGEVHRPGRFVLPEGATILDAIAAAGGNTRLANLGKVTLIHASTEGPSERTHINMNEVLRGTAKAAALHDGDTLSFPERIF